MSDCAGPPWTRQREKREARGEERREEREEGRGVRREERGEERGEEREEGREERGEKRYMRREERRHDDPGPTVPDWCRVKGVIIFAMYVSRVRTRVRASNQACGGLGFWRVWYVLRRPS